MQTDNYKENLKDALKNLIIVNESIFNSLIDISMKGDIKNGITQYPLGSNINLTLSFSRIAVTQIFSYLVKLIEKVDATFETIKISNSIQLDEQDGW